jgi:hypothetical protein
MSDPHVRRDLPAGQQTPDGSRHVAEIFVPLTDPTLLRLMEFVADEDRSVAECGAHLGVPHACAAGYLRTLADSGWVWSRSAGGRLSYGPSVQAVELMGLVGSMAAERSSVLASCSHIDGRGGPPAI